MHILWNKPQCIGGSRNSKYRETKYVVSIYYNHTKGGRGNPCAHPLSESQIYTNGHQKKSPKLPLPVH